MVTTFYPPHHFGGDGNLVRSLTHALARRGNHVDVIHDVDAYRALSDGSEPEPLTEPQNVAVHALRSRWGALSCLATQQLGRPLVHGRRIRSILRGDFDVIHFHNVSLVGGPGILSYGNAVKLYTTHEHWLVCPSHVLWRHNRERCEEKQCLRCVLHYRRPPQLWRATGFLQRQVKHVDAFLAPSRFCAQKHRAYGFDREMTVLPNFLADTPPAEQPPDSGQSTQRPFFLFVGRLEAIKGLQDVIPLFDDDGGAELWVAGTGGYESELRRLAQDRPCVRFLGPQTPEQLCWLYRRARAVVVPSICYEVFPMVVLEAFRVGTPIIARDLGPFPEIVEQSGGGLLFTNSDELAANLRRLAGDHQLRDHYGRAGQRAFQRHWSETVVVDRYLSLIKSIASRRRAPK